MRREVHPSVVCLRVLVTAGGGGHTGYAIAIAHELCRRGVEVFVGVDDRDRFSEEVVSRSVPGARVVKERSRVFGAGEEASAKHVFSILRLVPRWTRVLRSLGIDVVVATGSNQCFAPSIAAWRCGRKLVVLESCVRFAKPSNTVRLLGRVANVVALQWEEQLRFAPPRKSVVVGPLLPPHRGSAKKDLVVVTTGTWGFPELAELAVEMGRELLEICGAEKLVVQDVAAEDRDGGNVVVRKFIPNLVELLARAKLVITHFGRTAIEARALGASVVIVPNRRWLRTSGGALDLIFFARRIGASVVTNLSRERLVEGVREALSIPQPRFENGAARLADLIEVLI